MKAIYSHPDILTVFHNEEKNYILLKWMSFNISLSEIKHMHQTILDYAGEHDCHVYVADTCETISRLGDAIIMWWKETWISKMKENGIHLIVTILPRDIMAQLSTFEWQQGEYGGIKMVNVLTLEQANIAIETYRKQNS